MGHRNQFDQTPEEPEDFVTPQLQPMIDKEIRRIEEVEVYEVSIDKEPNAWGERLVLAEGPELPTVDELIVQESDPDQLALLTIIRDGLKDPDEVHIRKHRRSQHPNLKEQ